jgi:hypothetical protein
MSDETKLLGQIDNLPTPELHEEPAGGPDLSTNDILELLGIVPPPSEGLLALAHSMPKRKCAGEGRMLSAGNAPVGSAEAQREAAAVLRVIAGYHDEAARMIDEGADAEEVFTFLDGIDPTELLSEAASWDGLYVLQASCKWTNMECERMGKLGYYALHYPTPDAVTAPIEVSEGEATCETAESSQ